MDCDLGTLAYWLKTLNVPAEELNKSFTIWRFVTLHVRGVAALSSDDVYQYFNRAPKQIEWLSDISCNVTFANEEECVDAISLIAKGIVVHQNDQGKGDAFDFEVITSDKLTIPVPPKYRYVLGKEHANSKSIIVRFATCNDRKPDSSQMKHTALLRPLQIDLKEDREEPNRLSYRTIDSRNRVEARVTKPGFGMRMRADDEQRNIEKRRRDLRGSVRPGITKASLNRPTATGRTSIWRRTSAPVELGRRNVTDLRQKLLAKSTLRVQVTYDD